MADTFQKRLKLWFIAASKSIYITSIRTYKKQLRWHTKLLLSTVESHLQIIVYLKQLSYRIYFYNTRNGTYLWQRNKF